MKITRMVVVAALLLVGGGVAFAQQSKTDETLEFKPHWSLGVQGGVASTLGEADFCKLISPTAALSAQWHFHHAMGLRLGASGWQGKGAIVVPEYVYSFKYAQLNADYVLDLTGIFGGFNHKRVCSAYAFAGIGGAYGFDNKAALPMREYLSYYWGRRLFVVGRAGLGVDFRLGDVVSLGLEGNTNVYSDRLNSKRAKSPDFQFNLLAGLKFNLGKTTRPSKAYADKVAAEAAAAAALKAAEAQREAELRAEEARKEMERKAAEEAAAKAAAERKAAEEAAARAAVAAANSCDIFFTIGSDVIRKSEDAKVLKLAEWLKSNPDYSVALVGYSDDNTGTAKRNMILSKLRAEAVLARLASLGVDKSRVLLGYKGDTVQPYPGVEKNRVVICSIK